MIPEISLTGTPAQIGLERGRQLKIAIQLSVAHYVHGNTHQWQLREAHAFGGRMAKDLGRRCPDLLEEILHTGQGAGLSEGDTLAFAFRCWNALSDHPATLACYNIACRDPQRGTIVAGVLEDSPPFYILETVQPAKGIPFHAVTWTGMSWAVRGMNAAGLAVGQASSFAGTRFAKGANAFPFDLYARGYYGQRWALQNCDNVRDAARIIRGFDCTSTYMLADKTGACVALESCGQLHALRKPNAAGNLTGGIFESPVLIKALVDEGIAHDWEWGVRLAKKVMTKLESARGKTTMEWMARYLRAEQTAGGWCHDGLQAATIACPATGEFWVSGYRPCVSGFRKLRVGKLG
ncbi:MAG: hypothetical protein PHR35_08290 [Kiritimatiellae bacterium]|nr:hypothetical protein [Kiritimatiellia bacterium]